MAGKKGKRLPSPKQLQLLRQLTLFQHDHGYCPSMQELGDMLGISKVTVYQHVRALERKGLLTRLPNRARSLHVVGDGHGGPGDQSSATLNLLGTIAAGSPIDVYEVPSQIDLDDLFSRPDRIYALKVEGDSMIDEQIRDGDYVIVEPRNEAQQGETVVAKLPSGEVTLKKFYRERGRYRLQPANPDHKPIYTRQLKIMGAVIGLLRKY